MVNLYFAVIISMCIGELNVWAWVCFEIDFPGGFSGKEPPCQCRRHERCRFDPWVRKIPGPWRRKWQPTPVFFFFFLALVLYICCNECTNVNTILSTKRPTVYIKAPSLCCIILLALEKVSCYVSTMTAPYEIMLMP